MTTTITVDELERAAQDAAAEAAEAEQLVATLEERVLDGHDDVQPEQIEAQRSLSRFAGLRAEAAHRKVQRAQEARQAALVADLDAAVKAAVKPGGKCSHRRQVDALAQFKATVAGAAAAYSAVLDDQTRHAAALAQAARAAGVPEGHPGQEGIPADVARHLSAEQLVTPAGIVGVGGRWYDRERKVLVREAAAAISEAVRR
jgi:hypothetical protein